MKIFNDNNCGWIDYSNRRKDIKKLEKDLSCDCLIVGAGFTGLSAARKLGQIRKNKKIRKRFSLRFFDSWSRIYGIISCKKIRPN